MTACKRPKGKECHKRSKQHPHRDAHCSGSSSYACSSHQPDALVAFQYEEEGNSKQILCVCWNTLLQQAKQEDTAIVLEIKFDFK